MSAVFDMMGTVTSVSKDFGIVENPAIQGPVETTFRASKFYAFGVRCTGALTDFLDKGMQVKVRYIFGHPHSDIVAVWLGDKPHCLSVDPFYNREGRIVSVGDDHFIAKTDFCDQSILVSKDAVFCDGYRLEDTKTELHVGEVLMFDAVPIRAHSSEFQYQYLATCAWFGLNEPRILDRFRYFLSARSGEEYVEVDNVVGRVSVIPNDSVAVVDVDAFNSGKVILTKQNFLPPCESLRFAVSVGEELIMRLSFGRYYSDDEMWFAVAASKRCGSDDGLAIVQKRQREQPRRAWYIPPEDEEITTEPITEVDQTTEDDLQEEPLEDEQNVLLGATQDRPVLVLNTETELKCEISDDLDALSNDQVPELSEGEIIVPTSGVEEQIATKQTPFSPTGEVVCAFGYETSQGNVLVTSEEPQPPTNGQEESDVEVLYESPAKMPRLEEVWVPCPITLEDDIEVPVSRDTSSEDEERELSKAVEKVDEAVLAKALAFIREEEAAEAADVKGSGKDALVHFPEMRAPFGVYRGAPFKKGPGTRTYLLDWSAVVVMHQGAIKFSALVGPDFGEVSSEVDAVVINAMNGNKPVTSKTLTTNGQNVYFDAERSVKDDKFEVKRVWFKQFSRPSPELLLKPQLRYTGLSTFDRAQVYRGKIICVPLHDCAIASVDDVPVLVRLDSLVTDRDYNQSCTTIDMFLNVGSMVLVSVAEKREIWTNSYFEAKKCWKETLCLPTDHQVPNNGSWSDVWGTVELCARGIIYEKDGFVGISLSSSQSVDVTKCRFFFNGTLSRLSDHVGAIVNCHVTCVQGKYVVPFASNCRRQLIDYSFFGDRNLALPKNLIDEKAYEGVVEGFPLVDFAVCRIGVLPVISFLSPVRTKSKSQFSTILSPVKKSKRWASHFNTVVEKDVRVGQRVLLNVKHEHGIQTFKNLTFLVCTTMILNECNDDKKVLVNFPGRVVKQPRPTGLIEANGGKLKVSFDLSCVRNPLEDMNVASWAKRVRKILREKNASVHFTAKKALNPEKPHTAYMVWIDNF